MRPVATGLALLAAGLLPWMWLSKLNATTRPDLPWAALLSSAYIALLMAWRWPRRAESRATQDTRADGVRDQGLPTAMILAFLVLIYVAWTMMSRLSPLPDLSAYPTTAYRWSMFLMGGLTAGVVEEFAFRGWMLRGLDRVDPANANVITSAVFVLAHVTQGVGAMLVLAPGLFITSMLFGQLARRTGSIVPGMLIHVAGDLTRVYLGSLHGDASLLFVPSP